MPTHYRDKETFWEYINKLKKELDRKDLIFARDFNTTRKQSEKRGGTKFRDPFGEKMEDLMADLDMLDIPLKNEKYTWSNRRT